MRLSTRFFLLFIFVFTGVILTVWFGVRPSYEEAVVNERIVIASEHQREKIERVERQITLWGAATGQLKQDLLLSGNIERAELLFSGFSSVFSELELLRVIEIETGEFIEVRAQAEEEDQLPEPVSEKLSVMSMLKHLDEQGNRPMWLPEDERLVFVSQFELDGQGYLIMSLFESAGYHDMLLSHNLGIDVRSAVWKAGAEADTALLFDNEPPSYRPEAAPVGRAERRTVNGRALLVTSFPISSLNAQHTMYIEEASISEPVQKLFAQGLWVISIAFLALGGAAFWLLRQLTQPVKRFIEDVEPFAAFNFDRPFRKTGLPELNEITLKMEEVRQQLAHYQKINVEQVISNEQRLRLLIEHASDLIAVFDASGVFIFRNARFSGLFSDLELAPPETLEDFWNLEVISSVRKKEHKRSREASLTIESEFQEISVEDEQQQRSYFFSVQKAAVFDEQGRCTGGQLMMYDLTRERELDRRRNDMINIIVHELKNPLTGIKGIINMLQQQEMERSDAEEFYGIMERSADEMFELVQRFLQVSRLESETSRPEKEPVDFNRLIHRITSDTRATLKEKNLDIDLHLDESLPPVLAARDLMGDVVRNLLSNAIKYGPASRTIVVESAREARAGQLQAPGGGPPFGEWLVISITDYGYGIQEEYQEQIFKKFYRIKAYKTEQGTGLGLPYVKEIVERHDGHISVESNQEIGSRFIVRLPLLTETALPQTNGGGEHAEA